jgi:hypothetical protein
MIIIIIYAERKWKYGCPRRCNTRIVACSRQAVLPGNGFFYVPGGIIGAGVDPDRMRKKAASAIPA